MAKSSSSNSSGKGDNVQASRDMMKALKRDVEKNSGSKSSGGGKNK